MPWKGGFLQGVLKKKLYYGWVVVCVVFVALLVSAGVRAAPTVLIIPLESELGWGRAAISAAVSIGLLLYGLSGPAAGWLMDRFGPKLLTLFGLALIGLSTLMGTAMTELWQLNLFWGVLSGVGTGVVAPVLGATVANRWFVEAARSRPRHLGGCGLCRSAAHGARPDVARRGGRVESRDGRPRRDCPARARTRPPLHAQ
jgi:MFS family permease